MKGVLAIALLACLGCARSQAQQTYDADVESKIIALERAGKLQALVAKDLKTLDRLLDDAFVYVDHDGQLLTKADMLMFVQNADSLRCLTNEMVVRVHGNTAIVTGLYEMKGVLQRKPFVQQGRFVDTWLNRNGQWVAIASLFTPME
jgi:uncharacterized protein DUF4440